ncbi:MAG: DUF983 domain-containing protein [Anaerolineae bacterium]|nr:DUF983 domain-containing protein [Anaerolineae bacterium]
MADRKTGEIVHKLWVGARARCPHCEQGAMFARLFRMNRLCPACGVRFERQDGESIGGMVVNFSFAVTTALAGFFIVEAASHPPLLTQLLIWSVYCLAVSLLLYRSTRGVWVAVAYLTGGVRRDDEPAETRGGDGR